MVTEILTKQLRRIWFGLVIVLWSISLAIIEVRAGQSQGISENPTPPYVISLRVELIVLNVTVLNKNGGFVSDLDKSKFQIYEDHRPQEIKVFQHGDVPVTVGLVIDSSRSMRSKRSEVIAAAMAFVELLNPQDEVFIVNFNEHPKLELPPGKLFSNEQGELRSALNQSVPDGQTALYDALALAFNHLNKGRHEKKALLIVSDGGDNASQYRFNQVLDMARRSKATLYTVALASPEDRDQNFKVLKRLSYISGGEFFSPSSVLEVATLCRRVAHDIRNQYTLGYNSSNPARDGTYRSLKVIVNLPGANKFQVRAREGYVAAKEESPIETPVTKLSE
jgi:Ca-activated chloride channel homolog